MPLRDAIENRLRSPDQLVGLAHPVIKIAEFEFLALERCELQWLCRAQCCIRQVCIVHPTRPNQRRIPLAPQCAAGWCRCIAQWRRLFGLKHLAPLRDTAAPPRRALRHRGRGTTRPVRATDDAVAPYQAPLVAEPLRLTLLERREFEFSDLDDWMREADQLIRRSQAVLDGIGQRRREPPRSDAA